MAEQRRLSVILEGDSGQLVGVLRAAADQIERVGDSAAAAGADLEKAGKKGDEAAKRWENAGKVLGAAAASAVVGIAGLVAVQINAADQAGEMAARLSVSTEWITGMGYAAKMSGTDVAVLERGLGALTGTMAKAAGGSQEQLRLFAAIGVSATDATGKLKPLDQILPQIADKFAAYQDGPAKAALATRLFGDAGRELVPLLSQGAAGMDQLRARAAELGMVIGDDTAAKAGELNDQIDQLLGQVRGLATGLAAELLPTLLDVATAANEWLQTVRDDGTLESWRQGIIAAGETILGLLGYVDDLAVGVGVALAVNAIPAAIGGLGTLAGSMGAAAAAAKALMLALIANPLTAIAVAAGVAAAALYNYATAVDDADRAAEDLADVTARLAKAQGASIGPLLEETIAKRNATKATLELTKAELELAQAKVERIQGSLQAASTGANGALVSAFATSAVNMTTAGAQREVDALSAKVARLSAEFEKNQTEVDAAEQRLAAWKEGLGAAGNGAGKLTPPVVQSTSAINAQARAAKENEQRMRELSKAQAEEARAMQQLGDIVLSTSGTMSGPMLQALQENRREMQALDDVTQFLMQSGVAQSDVLQLLQQAYAQVTAAAQARIAAAQQEQDVVGRVIGDMDAEIALLRMSADARRIEIIVRQAQAEAQRLNKALSAEEVDQLRLEVAQRLATIDSLERHNAAMEEISDGMTSAVGDFARSALEDFGNIDDAIEDLGDSMLNTVKDFVAKAIAEFFKLEIINPLLNSLFGGNLQTGNSMLGSLFGGGGAGGSGNGILGNLFGGGGANSGMLGSMLFGGGSGFTGMMNMFRGGTISSSMGIPQVNAITGAQGASGGAGSIFGGGMMANGMSMGGMMGAGGGIMMGLQGIRTGNALQGAAGGAMAGMSIGGPWGALIGGIIGGLGALIHGKKPPDFRFGGENASVRNPEGGFETVFGNVRAGSRQISWESVVQPMQQFDLAIQNLVQSLGGGDEQLARISAALSTWSVDLRGDAATAEAILGSRFGAIMSTFDQHIQDFVGSAGTVEERVGRLADALTIDRFAESGELLSSFDDLAGVLTRARVGNEALSDTYVRVLGSTLLLESALALSGTSLDMTRVEFVNFAADIVASAGSLERAQSLWNNYFTTFYSAEERRALALTQAQEAAAREFAQIDLSAADFSGEGGAAQFRALFEQMLPSLSAEAVVQWLEAAEALGVLINLQGEYNAVLDDTVTSVTSLSDLMATVREELAEFAPPESFAARIQAISTATAELIARAVELGAKEEDIALIRELGQRRLQAVLDEQAAALAEYQQFVAQFRPDENAGLSEFQVSLRTIAEEAQQAAARANELAIAAGLTGAAAEDLANIQMRSAERMAAAALEVEASILGLAEQAGYFTEQADAVRDWGDTALGFAHWLAEQRRAMGEAPAIDPERLNIAVQIGSQLRELAEFMGESTLDTMARLRIPLDRVVADFGVALDQMDNPEVFDRFLSAARVLGVEALDAAQVLGVNVGQLSDAASMLNDAFERAIDRLPDNFQQALDPLLREYENAATPDARERARTALVSAIDALPPNLRAILAPFLDEIDTTALAEQQLTQLEQQNRYLSASVDHLAAIRGALGSSAATPVPPALPGEKRGAGGDSDPMLQLLREIAGRIDLLERTISRIGDRAIVGINQG